MAEEADKSAPAAEVEAAAAAPAVAAPTAAGTAAAAAAPPQFPQLTKDQAKEALERAIATFEVEENKARMEAAIAEAGDDPMRKMQMLVPLVQEIQGDVMREYGFDGPGAVMAATMQIQMHSMADEEMQAGVRLLMGKLNGN